ncbi:MAG: hypothetical protein R8J85_00990 [Mariprofundales bacterium]
MNASHVAAFGGACGSLIAFSICMVIGIDFYQTMIRVAVLGVAGAWIGMMLAWLNQLLPTMPKTKPKQNEESEDDDTEEKG